MDFQVQLLVYGNDTDKQIQFARHNFDNHQALIRSSDAKAGADTSWFGGRRAGCAD